MAALLVIEPIAIADVDACFAAIAPDRELHEPRKNLQKGAVELSCVDTAGEQANDVGAAARPIAALAIRMGGLEPAQDPSVLGWSAQRLSQFLIDPGHQHAGRYSVETVEAMQKLLFGYRDDLRVEVESSGYEANAS